MTEKRKEDENNSEEDEEQFSKATCGKTVTLQMLLDANILTPGKENMSIEYMGQKFIGDLLEDGKIKSHETETIFCSPSAWAINCKKIINPEKKSGCGWASVRYNGKKLDIFKAQYHKKTQKKKEEEEENDIENDVKENVPKLFEEIVVPTKEIGKHPMICNRTVLQDVNMLVETVPFSSIGRIQPFTVNVSISALLVMDFHCHLTSNEVCGYFGGTWDFNSHNLAITHCYPLLNSSKDRNLLDDYETKIQKEMLQKNIQLVGWYHSHHRFPAFPTMRDCDKQLSYQIKLRGNSDLNYTPCIGFIHGAYDDNENIDDEAKIQPFWVLPPPENRPYELGKPLVVSTNNREIEEVSDEIKEQLKSCVDYYETSKLGMIDFKTAKFKNQTPVLEKLKNSIFQKLPLSKDSAVDIWNWILELLHIPKEDPVEVPKLFMEKLQSIERAKEEEMMKAQAAEAKLAEEAAEKAAEKIALEKAAMEKIAAEQPAKVATPSSVLPLPANYKQSLSSTSTSFSSPRDSPASIPSSANSPAKFEIPVRSTPSPAKSESPSLKHRNSPARTHVTSNLKFDGNDWNDHKKNQSIASMLFDHPKSTNSNNFILPSEDPRRTPPVSIYPLPATLSHSSSKKSSTSTSNNSKPSASSSSSQSSKNANYWLSQIPNMEDFLRQLEKGDLSVLMQSPYNLPTTYSHMKDDGQYGGKGYENNMKSSSSSSASSNSKAARKEKTSMDLYNSLQLDAYKESSEKLLNLMKSPEYTQMLLKSAKMTNADMELEKRSTSHSHQRNSSSSSRQPTSQAQHDTPSKTSTSQHSQSSYYPPFDMKYFNEVAKQSSNMKKNFNPSKPEDFNALLQMELFSKTMGSNSSIYGKNSSSPTISKRSSEEATRKEKQHHQQQQQQQQQQQIDMSAYGIPANLRNYMYDMPSPSSSNQKSKSSSSKSQTASASSKQSSSYNSSSLSKEKANELKAMGYNTADILKINSLLSSSKDLSMLHPLYGDYYSSLGLLQNANSKGSMGGGESSASSSKSSKDYANFAQMIPSQLHAMSSLFPGTKPSDLEAILKNSYFSEQMLKAQRDMFDAGTKKSSKSSSPSSSTSPYKRTETPTQKKESHHHHHMPTQSELEISLQKSMESMASSIFKYGDFGLSRSYSATSTDSSRKSLSQSPVDFVSGKDKSIPPKRRMEYSSIAELSSSSKKSKYDDSDSNVLNLSSK